MTAFKEFAIGKFVLRFYKTDHVWTCTMTEDMLDEVTKEIEKLGSELDRIVELYTDKAIENEALKRHRNRLETLAEQMLQGDGNE